MDELKVYLNFISSLFVLNLGMCQLRIKGIFHSHDVGPLANYKIYN